MRRPRFIFDNLERRLAFAIGAFADAIDVGAPALSGSASVAGGTYTVSGSGSDIAGVSDQFQFVKSPLSADGSVVARVTSISGGGATKAGLMMRSSASADAAFAGVFVTPSSGLQFLVRSASGATASQTTLAGFAPPRFVRLTRADTSITASYSSDGNTWAVIGTAATPALGSAPLVGLAVTSRDVSSLATATFTSVSLLLPPSWTVLDIGSPALRGSAHYLPSSDRFEITAGGTGFGGLADQFTFLERPMTGDTTIVASLDTLSTTSSTGRAGVMARNSGASDAAFASLMRTGSSTLVYQYRPTNGGALSSVSIPVSTGPILLRLMQVAGSVQASYSIGGAGWTSVGGAQSITFTSASALYGLSGSSFDAGSQATASFSRVSLTPAMWEGRDVAAPSQAGSMRFDTPSNSFTLVGGGEAAQADQLHFASEVLNGNGQVVTRVETNLTSNALARAGVLCRADGATTSAYAFLYARPDNRVVYETRTTAGGAVSSSTVVLASAFPISLKLIRAGDVFSAYSSADGTTWTKIGPSVTIAMPTKIAAGVAVSASDGSAASARFVGTFVGKTPPPGAGVYGSADELFLDDLQARTLQFFWAETNPTTGLVPDGSYATGGGWNASSSIAAIGFGLSSLAIGDRRGWLSHAEAYQRAFNTVTFLYNNAASSHGFFYHFLDTVTGARVGTSELSSVDTAELMAGVLSVASYWQGTPLATTAQALFDRVDWAWMTAPNNKMYAEWKPETGFGFTYADFSEAVVLYLLGQASTTHPAPLASWTSWSRSPTVSYGGYTYKMAGTAALFTVQYPLAWFDLRGLTDSTGLNYHDNAIAATLAQRQWAINTAAAHPHFGPNLWGFTAADGPTGYTVWGGPLPVANTDGTIVPTAPGGSLAFTPRQSVDALRYMQQTYGSAVYKKYGFIDAFNPQTNWKSAIVLGIDAGMLMLAAENSRSGFVWDLFHNSASARQAIANAFPSVAPTVMNAISRRTVGAANVDLSIPTDGTMTIESRVGGATQIVLNFDANVLAGPFFSVQLTSDRGADTGYVQSVQFSGSKLTIGLSGAEDRQLLTIRLNDLRHLASGASAAFAFNVGLLAGDTNRDGNVNFDDLLAIAQNYTSATSDPGRGDVFNDGVVNFDDLLAVSQRYGLSLATVAMRPSSPASPEVATTTKRRAVSSWQSIDS